MNNFFNPEAELALLNIVLTNPDSFFELTGIKYFMFSTTTYQVIFSNILELVTNGSIPDANMLSNYLVSKDKIKEAGGQETLNFITTHLYPRENLREYEKQVVNAFKVRKLVELSTEVSKGVDLQNVDNTISDFRNSLDSLLQDSTGNSTASLADIAEEAFNNIVEKAKNPGIPGISFGIKNIDLAFGGILGGDVVIVASRPSMGKTALMCNSAIFGAEKFGNSSLIFSLEMKRQQMMERFVACKTGLSISDLRMGVINQKQIDQISSAVKEIKNLPVHLDCTFTPSLSYIISTARRYKLLYGIKLIYVDYLQLLVDRDDNQTAELGHVSRAFKLLAKELDIGVVMFSQLNRLVEMRPDRRPILSDLRQSGNLEEDADIVAFAYRDEYYDKDSKQKGLMEFIIRKNRSGPPGTVMLNFDAMSNRILEK